MTVTIGRRELVVALGGAAAAWPLAARAQQGGHMRRISVLNGLTAEDSQSQARNAAFLQGLGVGAHRNSSTRLSPYVRWSNGIWAPCSSADVSDDESMFPQSRIIDC